MSSNLAGSANYIGSSWIRVGDFEASQRVEHAGEDLEAQLFLVAQSIGSPLEDSYLVVEAFDEA